MSPDYESSATFLEWWRPSGPWVLTVISTDKKKVTTSTLHSSADVVTWLDRHATGNNAYFHVNPTISDVSKKATREQIASLDWLHVDIDPRPGLSLAEERDRALDLLTNQLPKGVPEPSCVVFSGGGYQGFWRLREPVPINGDLSKAEDAKLYNLQLETAFGADHCHNIDRIMRLPGTVNNPDAKKQAAGRKPELAVVISRSPVSYDIADFRKQPKLQETSAGLGADDLQLDGNIPEITDLNYLDQWNVPDRVKVIIAQGRHPDEPKKGDNSRSAWVFDCVCQLVRADVPPEVIFAVLTHKDFGISESVLNAKPSPERYALRQIARAREFAIDPKLMEMNQRHAVIGNVGGSCKVIEEVYDEALKRHVLTWSSFNDVRNRYMHKMVKVGEDKDGNPVLCAQGKWWLSHPNRRQYRQVVFRPNSEVTEDYNLWRGFAVAPQPGDWSIFRDHLWRNVCASDPELYDYLIGWMARCVQQPAEPGETAVVLRSGRGTGKSKVATQFGSLFGRHHMHITNASHLVGNFNAHLRDTIFLFADEAFFAGDKKHESVLKGIVTEKTLQIEAKGVDVQTQPNYIHLMMASNENWVVPAGPDERRYFVLDVGEENKQDAKFFAALDEQMDSGGREAFLYDLQMMDLSKFNVRKVPQTEALMDQKRRSLSPLAEWWYRCLVNGAVSGDGWSTIVPTQEAYAEFQRYLERWRVMYRGLNETMFGKELMTIVNAQRAQRRMSVEVASYDGRTTMEKKRVYVYILPELREARKQWEARYGKEKWDVVELSDEPF